VITLHVFTVDCDELIMIDRRSL